MEAAFLHPMIFISRSIFISSIRYNFRGRKEKKIDYVFHVRRAAWLDVK